MMNCERGVETTMTTITRITERSDGGSDDDDDDDANYRSSVQNQAKEK
jgi:hypothetical protein